MQKDLLIWGAYGNQNLGDEACLLASSRLLSKYRPEAKKGVMLRMRPSAELLERYRSMDLEPVYVFSWRCLLWLWRAQLIVGGGGMVDDDTPWFPVAWSSLFLVASRLFGHRPIFFCIGANPIHRRLTRTLVRNCYSLAGAIVVRDAKSSNVLTSSGVERDRVRIARDVVFSLDRDALPALNLEDRERPLVVLVVRHDNARTPAKAEFFAAIAEQFVGAGFAVRFTVHDLRLEYDLGILLQLEERFRESPFISVYKPACLGEVVRLFASAHAVVSSRYHPIILASILGTLPIAIADGLTVKLGSLVQDLEVPVLRQGEPEKNQVAKIRAIFARRDFHRANIAVKVREFKRTVEVAVASALETGGPPNESGQEIAAQAF